MVGMVIFEERGANPMPTRIFISYRRDDAKWPARQMYEAFARVMPREQVFIDIDSIPPGADFRKILKGWVDACDILLALVGPGWLESIDRHTGRRRLDDPNDFVRIEVSEALARGISVVPVLLDGAPMPDLHLLPNDISALVDRQAEFVDYRTFGTDVERLVKRLGIRTAPDATGDNSTAVDERDASASSFQYEDSIRPAGVVANVVEISRKVPVVAYVWADWDSSGMKPSVIEKVIRSHSSKVHLVSVSVNDVEFVNKVGVQSVPAVCVFRDGRFVDKLEKPKSERSLGLFIDPLVR